METGGELQKIFPFLAKSWNKLKHETFAKKNNWSMKQLQAKLGTRKKRTFKPKRVNWNLSQDICEKPSLQKVASFAEAPPSKF